MTLLLQAAELARNIIDSQTGPVLKEASKEDQMFDEFGGDTHLLL